LHGPAQNLSGGADLFPAPQPASGASFSSSAAIMSSAAFVYLMSWGAMGFGVVVIIAACTDGDVARRRVIEQQFIGRHGRAFVGIA
jgi:hypothetical protein